MKNVIYLVILKPTSHRTAEESLGVEYLASILEKERIYSENKGCVVRA